MPIGSEQPEVFEYTVEVRPGTEKQEETERKKDGKREKESMIDRGRTRPASDVKQQTEMMMQRTERCHTGEQEPDLTCQFIQ